MLRLGFMVFASITIPAFSQESDVSFSLDNPTFLDATVADYDVFLTAEMHWRKENVPRKKAMIEYLASQNSIDVLVVERSYDFGHWVNHYLDTGDSVLLRDYLNTNTFFNTRNGKVLEDEYAFYLWLRDFNQKNERSIRVVGIDLFGLWDEKPPLWSFLKFVELHPDLRKNLPESIGKAYALMETERVKTGAMTKWVKNLRDEVETSNIEDDAFLNFIFNLNQSLPWAKGGTNNYRDGEIAVNFLRYISKGEKVYGQYGLTHIALKNGKRIGWDTFGSVLNQDKYYAGKILSIGLICFDCDANSKEDSGDFPGADIFHHFLTQDDFDRLQDGFKELPQDTFVDLRNTDEEIKDYCQLLLVQFD